MLRESQLNGKRQWEVLMVSSQDAAPLERGAAEPKAAKGKAKSSRSVAAKKRSK